MKKMKQIVALALAAVMLFGMAGCKTKDASKSASSDDKDTFVVGFDQNFPPFGYVGDDGKFTGFDIDLAKECAKRMGKTIKLQPIDWDSKDMELEAGTIDCIWNGFTINGREDQYTWTSPYMDNSQVVVVKSKSGIKSLADLKGKTVEVQKESSAQSAIEDNADLLKSFGSFLTTADYNTALMDLEQGAVDAVAMDIFVAKDQIAARDDGMFTILDEQISTEQYGVGFLKGNTELRDEVQSTLYDMVQDGTFAKISQKWFKTDVCILDSATAENK